MSLLTHSHYTLPFVRAIWGSWHQLQPEQTLSLVMEEQEVYLGGRPIKVLFNFDSESPNEFVVFGVVNKVKDLKEINLDIQLISSFILHQIHLSLAITRSSHGVYFTGGSTPPDQMIQTI